MTFGFALADVTFTPGLAKRTGPAGVFDAAPILQGLWEDGADSDVLSFPRGAAFGNAVSPAYGNIDLHQGTIVFWWTPERSSGTAGSGNAQFLNWSNVGGYLRYDMVNGEIDLRMGSTDGTLSVSAPVVAGNTYFITASWAFNTIDGTNYKRISVNDVFTYGDAVAWTVEEANATLYVGTTAAASNSNRGLPEGLTVYRRVLYDGVYGTPPIDGSDELAAIYAAGAGLDPCLVTGSWDVTFCLPTDSDPLEAMVTGTGEAWSHPHSSSLPDVTFMSDGDPPGTPYAVECDGATTYVDCGSGATIDDIPDGSEIAVSIWVRLDVVAVGNYHWYAGKGSWTASGWHLYTHSNGNLVFYVNCATSDASATLLYASGASAMFDGKWHHISGHYDDTSKVASVSLDGVWSTAGSVTGVGAYVTEAAVDMLVGRRPSSATNYMLGGIAWWEVWDNDHLAAGTDFIPPRSPTAAGPGNLIETWWVDEGTGATVAARVTTPANDGTIVSGSWSAVWQQEGTPVIPSMLEFDGSATYVNVPAAAAINDIPDGGVITAELYMYLDPSAAGTHIVIAKGDMATTSGWGIIYNGATDQLLFRVMCDTANSTATIAVLLSDAKWHHVVGTYDDGTKVANVALDGVWGIPGGAGVGAYTADAARPLRIGRDPNGGSYFVGMVQDVRISDVARYVISSPFRPPGRGNHPAADGNTMVQYNFTDGAGTAVADTVGPGANNGAITMGTGRWWNSTDMENTASGERIYPWGYAIGATAAMYVYEGLTIIEDAEVTAGNAYVVRATLSIGMSGRARPFIQVYDNSNVANIVDFYYPRMHGQHSGANGAVALEDAIARWVMSLDGWTVYNITDGSSATITSTAEKLLEGDLAGGTDDDWDMGDEYLIRPPADRSYSNHPWRETFVFTAPAGCTSVDVKVLNAAGEGIVHVHQVEILASLQANGDMEVGAGVPWVPTGWTANYVAGEAIQEAVIVHSGASSVEIVSTAGNRVLYRLATLAVNRFYVTGQWAYGNGAVGARMSDANGGTSAPHNMADGSSPILDPSHIGASWQHFAAVYRHVSGNVLPAFYVPTSAAGVRYLDDKYSFVLDDVTMTIIPASLANSLEAPGLRVDGYDTCTQSMVCGAIAATFGQIRWTWTPRHNGPDVADFGHATPYIAAFIGGAANYIHVYFSAANVIRLAFDPGTGEIGDTWNPAAGYFVAGNTYEFEVWWNASGIRLLVDRVMRILILSPVNFASVPAVAWWGSNNAVANLNGDAVFGEYPA